MIDLQLRLQPQLKVLHVVSSLSPRFGGPTTVIRGLARHQVKAGLDVTVISTDVDFPKGRLPVQTNTPIVENGVRTWYFPFVFRPLLLSWQLVRWLTHHLSAFDVVHVHGLYRAPVAAAARMARARSIPYMICCHGTLDPVLYAQSQYSVLLKRIYEKTVALPNLNHATAIQYTAEDEVQRTAFLGLRAPTVVIPNGIDWDDYENLPPRGAFRRRLGIGNAPMVLFLGRLNFKKGLDLLIPAFAQVRRRLPKARLAIVGPDNEGYGSQVRQWCRDWDIAECVTHVDHLPLPEVREAYVDADVFVLPSYAENFGMTVVEAMACRCPVIVSDRVNIWRELQNAKAAAITQLNVDDIAQTLLATLTRPEEAHAQAERALSFARERYNWARIVRQMTAQYAALISNHHGSRKRAL